MIDLHLHTTASDGRSSPEALVREAWAAGISTCAVTDHDTVAGLDAARATATAAGLAFVPGIEITAVEDGRDIHILGYFIDPTEPTLQGFLGAQRLDRRRRVAEIVQRLDAIGVTIDEGRLLDGAATDTGRAIGRPAVARALVDAGHAVDISDAFDRYLSPGRPGFIARQGGTSSDVIGLIRGAGGVASLAHPAKTDRDDLIPAMVRAGLRGLEAYHPDHDAAATRRYLDLARSLGLLVTGGSDYHGPGSGRESGLGRVGLPDAAYLALVAAARER